MAIKKVPMNFGTRKNSLVVLKWMIEVKEQLTHEKLLKIYTCKWLIKSGLKSTLEKIRITAPMLG
ncbi:hypothetical protein COE56_28955 [Bacillus anthracis]|nr:hypothetical protein COE56_28955 [Bacillus anthracis]